MKSSIAINHIRDLQELFTMLKKYQIKLNPTMCTFRGTSRKLLVYSITLRGIEDNRKKITAVLKI